jgi:hypothetical protein
MEYGTIIRRMNEEVCVGGVFITFGEQGGAHESGECYLPHASQVSSAVILRLLICICYINPKH